MLGGGGTEQKGTRTQGHGQQCGDCCGGEKVGIRGLNGNGKNTIKIKSYQLYSLIKCTFVKIIKA